MIVVLSGGVGAARLLRALRGTIPARDVTAVVNVGDDLVMHGLTICPDLDTITYTLAGLNNDELGWGLTGESWRVMEELAVLGGESWFRLGDRDLATHLYRSERLRRGATKSDVTEELCARHGVAERLLPVSDDDIRTTFVTAAGRLSFQEYFVRHHHDIDVHAVEIEGAPEARPAPGVLESLRDADRIIIAPSNPVISIEPVLQVPGVREILRRRRADVVAVSPLIQGAALKGPADRLMRELGHEPSSRGVAGYYRELVGTFILDELDADLANDVRALDMDVRVTTTIMSVPEHARQLAQVVLA